LEEKTVALPERSDDDSLNVKESPGALKNERLEVRLTAEQKRLAQRAVALKGCTMTDFIRQAVQDAALRAVTEHDVMVLCVDDQEAFAAALLSPPEPGPRLRKAYGDYRKRLGR